MSYKSCRFLEHIENIVHNHKNYKYNDNKVIDWKMREVWMLL